MKTFVIFLSALCTYNSFAQNYDDLYYTPSNTINNYQSDKTPDSYSPTNEDNNSSGNNGIVTDGYNNDETFSNNEYTDGSGNTYITNNYNGPVVNDGFIGFNNKSLRLQPFPC